MPELRLKLSKQGSTDWLPLGGSFIKSMKWTEPNKLKLRMVAGNYEYDVDYSKANGLYNAGSPGKYYNEHIKLKHLPINSSFIESMKFTKPNKLQIKISGHNYNYKKSESIAKGLYNAKSPGKYYNENIKLKSLSQRFQSIEPTFRSSVSILSLAAFAGRYAPSATYRSYNRYLDYSTSFLYAGLAVKDLSSRRLDTLGKVSSYLTLVNSVTDFTQYLPGRIGKISKIANITTVGAGIFMNIQAAIKESDK